MSATTPIIDYGVINFVRNRREAKADFLRVADTVPVSHLLRFMTRHWRLSDPGIIVQVTGSAQGFDLPANLVTPITEGIVAAANVADAWILTGGFDAELSAVTRTVSKEEEVDLVDRRTHAPRPPTRDAPQLLLLTSGHTSGSSRAISRLAVWWAVHAQAHRR